LTDVFGDQDPCIKALNIFGSTVGSVFGKIIFPLAKELNSAGVGDIVTDDFSDFQIIG
jgi:hypothetical protein